MKKRIWLIPMLSLAIAAAAGVSAYAAEGWQKENDKWVYYNSSGNKAYDKWVKGADDKWRWVNSYGEMAVSSWVDNDTYYVDSDGIYLVSQWLKLNDETDGEVWYYFNNKGKAVKEAWQQINSKWYYFDYDGKMLKGWILDDMYYCGSDGAMKTGWQKLEDPDSNNTDNENKNTPYVGGATDTQDDNMHYYYFSTSNGKKAVPSLNGADYGEKKIDGKKYCFDENGAMQTGWVNVVTSGSTSDITDFRYYNSDGSLRTGWYSLEPPDEMMANYDDEVVWFYFSSTGVPKAADSSMHRTSDFVKINGKTYLFDENGTPVYGLQKVYNSSYDSYDAYYFGTKNQCTTQSGKISIEEGDGTKSTFYFQKNGSGYSGVHDNYLYYKGKLQKADSGCGYQAIFIDGVNYVVNTSGRVEKNKTVKDKDGVKLTTSSGGILIKIDGESVGDSYMGDAATEPAFD